MKLVASKTELTVLRSICGRNPALSGTLLSSVDSSYFFNEYAKEIYGRILSITRSAGAVPVWRDLFEDPKLHEGTRDKLKTTEIERIRTKDEAKSSIIRLNDYRQMRGLYALSDYVVGALREKKASADELLAYSADQIVKLRQTKLNEHSVLSFGVGNNTVKIVKSLLEAEEKNFIPTGFSNFDDENGGITFGSLFTIGGTSGGGKSALASQLALNWSGMGEHVAVVPLEMSEQEQTARIMANAAELDVRKILFQRLSKEEKIKYLKAFKRLVLRNKKAGGAYKIFKPQSDMAIEDIMAALYPTGTRIKIIDYISLLKGIDGDDQWQKLGAVARYCKVYAENHNEIVVLLCQVNDEGKIRYAQAIKEHCVVGGTFVDVPQGLKRIDSLAFASKLGDQKLKTSVVSEGRLEKTSHWHYNGKRKVYELTAANGQAIKATAKHRFLTVNPSTLDLEWKELSKLKVQDYVALPNRSLWSTTEPRSLQACSVESLHHNIKVPHFPKHLTADLARYIGGMLSDGYIGKYHLQYVTIGTQKELVEVMSKAFGKCFGAINGRVTKKATPAGVTIYRHICGLNLVKEFLLKNFDGLSGGSKEKFIPTSIMQSGKKIAAACLRGMFDGDGSVGVNSLSLSSSSKEMLRRAQLLLQKFGIHSSLSNKSLTIYHNRYLKVFLQEVGLDCKEKREKLEACLKKTAKQNDKIKVRQGSYEVLPYLRQILNAARTHTYSKDPARNLLVDMGVEHMPNIQVYKKHITSRVSKRLNEIQFGLGDRAEALCSYDWVKVSSIEGKGIEKVYDLTVPSTSSFVADGFVTHNSSYCWVFVSTKQTRENELLTVDQLKARNGRQFDFSLRAKLDVMRIRDLELEEQQELRDRKKKKRKSGSEDKEDKRSSPSDSYLADIADEDD